MLFLLGIGSLQSTRGQLLLGVPSGVTFEVPGVANGSFDPLRLLALQGALEKSGFAYHWDLLLSKRKATS